MTVLLLVRRWFSYVQFFTLCYCPRRKMPFVEPREPSTIQFTIDSAQHCPYFYAKDSLRLRPSKNQKEPLNLKFQMKMDTCRRGYKNKIDGPGWAGKV